MVALPLAQTPRSNLQYWQQFTDDDDDLKWRGDLLRSIADLFEREKRALLAELRADVVVAHGEAPVDGDVEMTSRLESLERKIRNQVSSQSFYRVQKSPL